MKSPKSKLTKKLREELDRQLDSLASKDGKQREEYDKKLERARNLAQMAYDKDGKSTEFESEYLNAITDLENTEFESGEENYDDILKRAERLKALLDEKEAKIIPWIPVIVGGLSVMEIILILNYEQLRPVVSKAMSRIVRGRV